jgi:hypothetical protein
VLHERILIVHVSVEEVPIVAEARRLKIRKLGKGFFAITIHHGFFETPDIPRILEGARAFGLAIDVATTTFFIGHETLVPSEHSSLGRANLSAVGRVCDLARALLSSATQPGGGVRHPDRDLKTSARKHFFVLSNVGKSPTNT